MARLNPKVLIPAALLLLLAGGVWSRRASAKKKRRPAKRGKCHPFKPLDHAKLAAAVEHAVEELQLVGTHEVSLHVAEMLYPVNPISGYPILWDQVSQGSPAYVQCMWDLIVQEVLTFHLAEPDPLDEPAAPVIPSTTKVLNDLISSLPRPGSLFKIKRGWTMGGEGAKSIAYQALLNVDREWARDDQARLAYIHCITSGPRWNLAKYAAPTFSATYPPIYGVGGLSLRAAFFPWHQDAIAEIVNARMPTRMMTPGGDRIDGGTHYALLWLPPVDEDEFRATGRISCAPFVWSDDSSSIDPPPELLYQLSPSVPEAMI